MRVLNRYSAPTNDATTNCGASNLFACECRPDLLQRLADEVLDETIDNNVEELGVLLDEFTATAMERL